MEILSVTQKIYRRKDRYWLNTIYPAIRMLSHYSPMQADWDDSHPLKEPAVFISNHGTWFAFDTLVAAYMHTQMYGIKHLPYTIVEEAIITAPIIRSFYRPFGVIHKRHWHDPEIVEKIKRDRISIMIFPEGCEGLTKPFWKAYQCQRFHTGFIRLAATFGYPIVPYSIVGCDECFPVLTGTKFTKKILGTRLPIPLSVIPLPVSWHLTFHGPYRRHLTDPKETLSNRALQTQYTEEIQAFIQTDLDQRTQSRPLVRLARFLEKRMKARSGNGEM